jgi:succinyl-CoA synthetase beta subunit
VVRLAGTNAEEGMDILNADALGVEETLEGAVQKAVEHAGAAGGDGGEGR